MIVAIGLCCARACAVAHADRLIGLRAVELDSDRDAAAALCCAIDFAGKGNLGHVVVGNRNLGFGWDVDQTVGRIQQVELQRFIEFDICVIDQGNGD